MKNSRLVCMIFTFCMLTAACALEGAPIIGPAGGYVFYDKGNYSDSWRYIECAKNAVEKDNLPSNGDGKDYPNAKAEAEKVCTDYAFGGYSDWYLPEEHEARQMLKLWKDGLDKKQGIKLASTKHWYWTTSGVIDNSGGQAQKGWTFKSGADYYFVRPVRRF